MGRGCGASKYPDPPGGSNPLQDLIPHSTTFKLIYSLLSSYPWLFLGCGECQSPHRGGTRTIPVEHISCTHDKHFKMLTRKRKCGNRFRIRFENRKISISYLTLNHRMFNLEGNLARRKLWCRERKWHVGGHTGWAVESGWAPMSLTYLSSSLHHSFLSPGDSLNLNPSLVSSWF